jgi:hypothetical protein
VQEDVDPGEAEETKASLAWASWWFSLPDRWKRHAASGNSGIRARTERRETGGGDCGPVDRGPQSGRSRGSITRGAYAIPLPRFCVTIALRNSVRIPARHTMATARTTITDEELIQLPADGNKYGLSMGASHESGVSAA